ncbi:MAG: hypothetical protein NVSMB22_22270 [Chloroflexota bacterium]
MPPSLSTNRLRLLDPADRAALYDRPAFTDEDRQVYFALTPAETVLLPTWTDGALQAIFILLLGYFKAKPRLFSVTLAEVLPDLTWICQHHRLVVVPDTLHIPNDRTPQQPWNHVQAPFSLVVHYIFATQSQKR